MLNDPERYRTLIGRLLYLNLTRPDITYIVQQLSQHVHAPQEHWDTTAHVFRYLKNCPSKGLFFLSNNDSLIAYCGADWTSCIGYYTSLIGY